MAGLFEYIQGRGLWELTRDGLDVFITYYVIYRVCMVLRGTRALQIGIGLALVFALYAVAQVLRLSTVQTLLNAVLSSALLIVVVVFQSDIRRGLMRVGSGAWFGAKRSQEAHVIDEVVEAATELARNRTGAIIALEQDANLDEFVGLNKGRTLDAAVTMELLVALFVPEAMNKLHDGAVIIRNYRVAKAGVFFPLPEGKVLDQSFGSRHRAALGISEETDAVVVVVSEERGSISFIFNGNIASNLDGPKLRAALNGIFAPKPKKRPSRPLEVSPASAPASLIAGEQEPEDQEVDAPRISFPPEESPISERATTTLSEATTTAVHVSEAPAPLRKAKHDHSDETTTRVPRVVPHKMPMRASIVPPAPDSPRDARGAPSSRDVPDTDQEDGPS